MKTCDALVENKKGGKGKFLTGRNFLKDVSASPLPFIGAESPLKNTWLSLDFFFTPNQDFHIYSRFWHQIGGKMWKSIVTTGNLDIPNEVMPFRIALDFIKKNTIVFLSIS